MSPLHRNVWVEHKLDSNNWTLNNTNYYLLKKKIQSLKINSECFTMWALLKKTTQHDLQGMTELSNKIKYSNKRSSACLLNSPACFLDLFSGCPLHTLLPTAESLTPEALALVSRPSSLPPFNCRGPTCDWLLTAPLATTSSWPLTTYSLCLPPSSSKLFGEGGGGG
jgi:hypothetical protein